MPAVRVPGYQCTRCGWQWVARLKTRPQPLVCPNCKSPYWDESRRRKERDDEDDTGRPADV